VVETITMMLQVGVSKIEDKSSKADYPALPDVGTVFDVCWEITRATVLLGRWMRCGPSDELAGTWLKGCWSAQGLSGFAWGAASRRSRSKQQGVSQ
jgi:hypothetical protein